MRKVRKGLPVKGAPANAIEKLSARPAATAWHQGASMNKYIELARDLRGTKSYERRECAEAIEDLVQRLQAVEAQRDELLKTLKIALARLEFFEVEVEGEWGYGRSLQELEADGDLGNETIAVRAAIAKAQASTQAKPGMSGVEKKLRLMLCLARADRPYMDDGEAQDNSDLPAIDFLRDTPDEIEAKLYQRNLKKFQQAFIEDIEAKLKELNHEYTA